MAGGGGTWRIVVEDGRASRPTQSTLVGGKAGVAKSRVNKPENIEASGKAKQIATLAMGTGLAITKSGFNQYYSITGQGAQRNRLNTTLTYGAAVTTIGVQLATGNLVGAAVATIGTGLAAGTQYVNFQRDIADQNAMAEYLRQQSGTSVSANRGEFFNFKLT
jgi:hypothetical protein